VADSVDAPKTKRREMAFMTESDVHILLEFCKSTAPVYYSLFYLALFTGMRRSELLALRWCDIDFDLCQLSISRTLHQLYNREIIIREPKTAKGRRLIALTPSTVAVIREHKEAQTKLRQSLCMTLTDDDYVFSRYDGTPMIPDSVTQVFRKLAKRTGLKGIHLHSCRHTHASLLLKQNVHPAIVAQRLGHASVQITMDIYSHILPGIQEAVAKNFDNALFSKEKET
jgi:integrase